MLPLDEFPLKDLYKYFSESNYKMSIRLICLMIWVSSWTQENLTVTSIWILGKNNYVNAFFCHSMEEICTNRIIPICFILVFNVFLFHSSLIRPRWCSDKALGKVSHLSEFLRIIADKISIDLVLHWCKIFPVSLVKIFDILGSHAKKSKAFLEFLSTILKKTVSCILAKSR